MTPAILECWKGQCVRDLSYCQIQTDPAVLGSLYSLSKWGISNKSIPSNDKIIFHVLFGAFHITPRISKSLKRAGATWIDRIRGQNNGHWWIHDWFKVSFVKLKFTAKLFNFFSDAETEVWQTTNEKDSLVDPKLPHAKFVHGVALYIVDFDFCKK